jgi:hypothetical protein
VKELKLQNASATAELNKVQDLLVKQKAENERMSAAHEEKVQKIKGLFAVANKTINDQKQAIAGHEAKVAELESKLVDAEQKVTLEAENASNLKQEVQRMVLEQQDKEVLRASHTEEALTKLVATERELAQVKKEFSNYKLRAHAALSQQASQGQESKLTELEMAMQVLQREKQYVYILCLREC